MFTSLLYIDGIGSLELCSDMVPLTPGTIWTWLNQAMARVLCVSQVSWAGQ